MITDSLFHTSNQAYSNIGQSFHSNDARGAVINEYPSTGESTDPIDLLVLGQGDNSALECPLLVNIMRRYLFGI